MKKRSGTFITTLAILTLSLGIANRASASSEMLNYAHACQSDEKWGPEDNPLAPYLQARIEWSRPGRASPGMMMKSFLRSLAAQQKAHGERSQALVQYWQAHAMLDLKLTTEATHAFNQIISEFKSDETLPLRGAAMACLIHIHTTYPTLTLEPATIQANAALAANPVLSIDEKAPFYEGLLWELKTANSDARAKAIVSSLRGGGFYEYAANALYASRTGNEAEIVKNDALFDDPLFQKRPQEERDGWRSLFGMAFYGLHRYKEAIVQFKQIPNTSNRFVRTLSDIAWANLWMNKYEEAIGSAENLVVGTLRKTFSPEGFETLSIALNETCNFTQALETYHRFQKLYSPTYRYLTELDKEGEAGLYYKVTAYFRGKLKAPDRIGVEWLGDQTFIANQAEINLGVDAVNAARRARRLANVAMRDPEARKWKWGPLWQKFDTVLYNDLQKIPGRKLQLVEGINLSIKAKNTMMRDQLLHTAENLQLLEAEAYETLGDQIIAENGPDGGNAKIAKDNNRHHKDKKSVWDWGRYPANGDKEGDDNQEVWEDEVGFLSANLKKSCD